MGGRVIAFAIANDFGDRSVWPGHDDLVEF